MVIKIKNYYLVLLNEKKREAENKEKIQNVEESLDPIPELPRNNNRQVYRKMIKYINKYFSIFWKVNF